MGRIPKGLSGQQVRRALERAGFVLTRQKGSHMVLYRAEPKARVVVPNHSEVRVGTLAQILQEAGLSVEAFEGLL
jgi:predicted RNA binding protein YcfA (HicA-like mRNA interferase family)